MRTGLLPAALLVLGVAVPARATRLVIPGAAQLRPVVAHPEREPRVFPRRSAELSLHGAGARVAHCDEPCGGVARWGYAAGTTALVRLAPSFAWGLVVDYARFRWQPEGRSARGADAMFLGLAARPYFTERSRLDPWLELSVSINAIGFGAGAGLDVFVLDQLKVGPRAYFTFAAQSCGRSSGGGIGPEPLSSPGIAGVAQLGIATTLAFGAPSR